METAARDLIQRLTQYLNDAGRIMHNQDGHKRPYDRCTAHACRKYRAIVGHANAEGDVMEALAHLDDPPALDAGR